MQVEDAVEMGPASAGDESRDDDSGRAVAERLPARDVNERIEQHREPVGFDDGAHFLSSSRPMMSSSRLRTVG